MFLEAIQARLKVLEEEILRLTRIASQASDNDQQDNYCRLAEDTLGDRQSNLFIVDWARFLAGPDRSSAGFRPEASRFFSMLRSSCDHLCWVRRDLKAAADPPQLPCL